jgi:hypothetical protein
VAFDYTHPRAHASPHAGGHYADGRSNTVTHSLSDAVPVFGTHESPDAVSLGIANAGPYSRAHNECHAAVAMPSECINNNNRATNGRANN